MLVPGVFVEVPPIALSFAVFRDMVPATAVTYCTVARLEVLTETQIASFL